MTGQDSEDYELMPKEELDDLRREVSSLKKNSLSEGDKARILIESMDRLTISINRLITILDDAQKDIIEEYQQAKPAEKLNRLLEQNDTIAKALLAVHENLNTDSAPRNLPLSSQQFKPPSNVPLGAGNSQKNVPFRNDQYPIGVSQSPKASLADNPYSMMPPSMPPGEDFNTIDTLPPLDNPPPNIPKKKFLGIM